MNVSSVSQEAQLAVLSEYAGENFDKPPDYVPPKAYGDRLLELLVLDGTRRSDAASTWCGSS